MADAFDDHLSIKPEWRRALGTLIAATHRLDWLLLTKRPENIKPLLRVMFPDGVPLNVRIGVSIEDQTTADERIQALLHAWSGPNFVSYEPALGPVDFSLWFSEFWRAVLSGYFDSGLGRRIADIDGLPIDGIDWIISGAESGPGARPAHQDWFRSVRDQCQAAGVPFFMKQMSKKAPIPDDLMKREFPE